MRGPLEDHLAWMRLRGLREATITKRRYALVRLRHALGHDPLTATREELAEWQRGLTLSAVSMNTMVMHVTGYFRWAHEVAELIGSNPATRLVHPRKPKRLPRPMSEENLSLAVDCAPPDIRLMLILAAYAGLRAGELARLDRADILDGNRPPVVMVDGKGGRERVVPLSSRVLMELAAYRPPAHGPLFPRRDGRPGGHTPSRVSQRVNTYLHELGIGDTIHQARHYFGTACYARTPDLRIVQELLGHQDPATTSGYVEYSRAKAMDAVEALGRSLPDRSPSG